MKLEHDIAKVTTRHPFVIARGGATEVLEGGWTPSRLVILEFPSVERAKEWWSSPEYAAPKALRQATADTELVILEGLDSPIG